MVAAGVYMVARTHVLFEWAPLAATTVALVGALTALYAASIATVQDDIKRVLANSTISQLGYMFLAVGIGAYAAGMFHLVTHAFFKALMFLGAGSVMHALANEVNMQRMGGLARRMPITTITFAAGWLSIAGIPPFSGFFSKDEILAAAFNSGRTGLWLIGLGTAALTAFYMSRHFFLVFLGQPRSAEDAQRVEHAHDPPPVMIGPLIMLALLATLGGTLGASLESYLEPVFGTPVRPSSGASELGLATWPLLAGGAGIGLAWLTFVRGAIDPVRWALRLGPIYRLLKNKYYVDELYDALWVRPLVALAEMLAGLLDQRIIDGAVNSIGQILERGGLLLRRVQTGYVRLYAFTFLLGVVGILAYVLMD
jgi:NADH-quinone oxidoreductase subunit L